MDRRIAYTAGAIYLVTAIVWAAGLWDHPLHMRELLAYLLLFIVPGGLLVLCARLIFTDRTWTRVLGIVLAVPCLAVWLLSLTLAFGEFRIH